MPDRIQRKRTKGWRAPKGAVYVGRGTRWGNPYIVGKTIVPPVCAYTPKPVHVRDAAHAVRLYKRWLLGSVVRCEDLVPLLAGRDLMCWCPLDAPCHADVLLSLANGGEDRG